MYYIVEHNYVGPNQSQQPDADHIDIQEHPACTNMSGEERTEGWCGTTNDWSVTAHGEYPDLESARKALEEIVGPCRASDEMENCGGTDGVVESYRPGLLTPLSAEATENWVYDGLAEAIASGKSDEEIVELMDAAAREDGLELDDQALRDLIKDNRPEPDDDDEEEETDE